MEELQQLLQDMDAMEIVYWVVALVGAVAFCIQTIMLFAGFDTDADFSGGDVDFDADGLQLVSVKTIVCFLLGFGWTGALIYPVLDSKTIVALIAVAVGVSFMLLIAFLLKQVLKLSRDNTFDTEQIIGATAEVYLRIPGGRENGKITVSHYGSMHELLAFADSEIATGERVKVIEAIDESSVKVEPVM